MDYLMAGRLSELERLQLQSRVWEPAGQRLLTELGEGTGRRAVDIGCGCYGWLPLLSRWVGPTGRCAGTEIDERMLQAAALLVKDDRLDNVELIYDDLFDSRLPAGSFDLVHARFQLAPIGRFSDQLASYQRLLRPGGVLVLEDPDASSWRCEPDAPATARLIELIQTAFTTSGGDFNAGRRGYPLLADAGHQPQLHAEIVALPPSHPYLQLPLQFAASLHPNLARIIDEEALNRCIAATQAELADPARWGLTFTLVQTWARID